MIAAFSQAVGSCIRVSTQISVRSISSSMNLMHEKDMDMNEKLPFQNLETSYHFGGSHALQFAYHELLVLALALP